ncbi:hypothetical protein HDE_07634 [Halotydeus destructor]|nr:hypothetical protein HDE_07634 [Halotydeus destructor]
MLFLVFLALALNHLLLYVHAEYHGFTMGNKIRMEQFCQGDAYLNGLFLAKYRCLHETLRIDAKRENQECFKKVFEHEKPSTFEEEKKIVCQPNMWFRINQTDGASCKADLGYNVEGLPNMKFEDCFYAEFTARNYFNEECAKPSPPRNESLPLCEHLVYNKKVYGLKDKCYGPVGGWRTGSQNWCKNVEVSVETEKCTNYGMRKLLEDKELTKYNEQLQNCWFISYFMLDQDGYRTRYNFDPCSKKGAKSILYFNRKYGNFSYELKPQKYGNNSPTCESAAYPVDLDKNAKESEIISHICKYKIIFQTITACNFIAADEPIDVYFAREREQQMRDQEKNNTESSS